MSSFDVTSFFANAMLDKTIKIILKSVYEKKEIVTTIPKREKKKILCTKNVPFSFNNEIHMQKRMGSPLVLANICKVELERTIIPSTSNETKLWKSYFDDKIAFVKTDKIKSVFSSLNSYHGSIQSTMEVEQNLQLPFLCSFDT